MNRSLSSSRNVTLPGVVLDEDSAELDDGNNRLLDRFPLDGADLTKPASNNVELKYRNLLNLFFCKSAKNYQFLPAPNLGIYLYIGIRFESNAYIVQQYKAMLDHSDIQDLSSFCNGMTK